MTETTITAFAIFIALLICGVATMFFGVQFYAYLWLLRQGMTLRRTLKKTGRTISLQNAKEKINAKQGILIADAPTLGWNVSRLWWSEDTNFLPRTFKTEEEKLFPPEDPLRRDAPSSFPDSSLLKS